MGLFKRHKWLRGKFHLSVDKSELFLGEELKGIVSLKGEGEFDVEKIWVRLRCMESVAVWDEELGENWDEATLYSDDVQVSGPIHVNVGFDKELPFVVKLPSNGRETYHSVHQNVQWLLDAYIKIKGYKYAIGAEGRGEITVAKHTVPVKEVVREVVLIPCAYCSGLMPQTSIFCPNCGARRKN